MRIEQFKEFRKAKQPFKGELVYAEEHDLILFVHYNGKQIVLVRFSTGEIVLKHRFGLYSCIWTLRRIGKWVFIRVSQPADNLWAVVDLETLVVSDFAQSRGPNGRGLIGITEHHAIFALHTGEGDYRSKAIPDAFLFDLRDGSSWVCPELSAILRNGVYALGRTRCFAAIDLWEESRMLTAYGVDEHGLPSLRDPVPMENGVEILRLCSEDRYVSVCETPGGSSQRKIIVRDPAMRVVNEAVTPPPDEELTGSSDDAPQILLLEGASPPVALLAVDRRKDDAPRLRLYNYYCYDRDFRTLLWHHEVIWDMDLEKDAGTERTGVILDGYLVHSLKDGARLIKVSTGEAEDVTLENVGFFSSTSYRMPDYGYPGFGYHWNPPVPTKHLFWQSDYGTPLRYGQVVE